MSRIIFYEDSRGNKPVLEFINRLKKSKGKDSKIRLNKLLLYIKILLNVGTRAGEEYIKHLEGDIWELRPLRDRIFFAGIKGGKYVLLHHYFKKTQKTPRREIEKAKREWEDFKERSGIV